MTCFLPDELYCTNIPGEASEAEVVGLLQQFGKVREYVVVSKRKDLHLTQAALVRMADHAGALAVKKALNRIDFKSKHLNIRWSHTQRVIWASNLHESVTNEMLRAAFSQFGNIQRALVVADAQTLATKCYGFVVFENKKDAAKAMAKCVELPFMIGQCNKPVKVEWARLEDTDQGFSEEARAGRGSSAAAAGTKDLNPQTVSRFAAPGTRESLLAVRLAEVDVEYQAMKQAMRASLAQLQQQIAATGSAPSLAASLAYNPSFAAIRAGGAPPPVFAPQAPQPPYMTPTPLQQQPPPQYGPPPTQYAPPPTQYAPPAGQYTPPQGQYMPGLLSAKRPTDEFHHVPPPKRADMRPKDPDFERFNPEASARAHNPGPPPAKPPATPAPTPAPTPALAPAPRPLPTVHKLPPVAPATSFVKGGQLNAAAPVEVPASEPNGAHQQQGQGEVPAASPPGAKLPGQPDFRGIGFTGSVPQPQPPSAPYAAPQQTPQYQAPPPPPPQQQQQQQQYGQSYTSAPGPHPSAYNHYAQPLQQPAPQGQQYSYPPPQQQQQQQYAQQQAPAQCGTAPYFAPQAQYGTPQPAPQYAVPGQYGTPVQYAAGGQYGNPAYAPPQPQATPYQSPPAHTSPPAMSGYNVVFNVVGGQQQQQHRGQYAQATYS